MNGITLEGAQAITTAFNQAPQIALQEMETAMHSSVAYLKREAVDRTPEAWGTLRAGWIDSVQVQPGAQVVEGLLSNPLPYAMPVEMGTRPHFPPLAPLVTWVEKKLGLSGADAERAARGVQRKIGRFGTPGFGMARYALLDGTPTILAEFEAAAARMSTRIAAAGRGGDAGAAL